MGSSSPWGMAQEEVAELHKAAAEMQAEQVESEAEAVNKLRDSGIKVQIYDEDNPTPPNSPMSLCDDILEFCRNQGRAQNLEPGDVVAALTNALGHFAAVHVSDHAREHVKEQITRLFRESYDITSKFEI